MLPRQDNFPWEYLRHASMRSLESFELARLSHAANLRKEIATLVDQWLQETASALLARWLLEHWAVLRGAGDSPQNPVAAETPSLQKHTTALGAAHRLRGGAST